MPTFRTSTALAAGIVNNNLLTGSIYEFVGVPTRVIVAMVSDQTDVLAGVNFGARTLQQQADGAVPLEPGAGQGPNLPDQVVVDDIAMPGERLVISLQGGAAASVTRTFVQLTPQA